MTSELTKTAPAASRSATVSWGWPHLAYFLGVPLVIAVYAGLNNWEIRHSAGIAGSLTFYAAHAFLPWWTTCLCTTAAKLSLARWKPPWALLLLLGHFLGSLLVLPYSNWLTGFYVESIAGLEVRHSMTAMFSTEFWQYLLRAGVIWFGVNFLFDRFLGLPLYRYTIPRGYDIGQPAVTTAPLAGAAAIGKTDWPGNIPAFISRLPQSLAPDEILAIKAEQHYIKIMTPDKQYMVLCRFSDAIHELDPALGLQVHRSYWVNTKAIETVHAKAKDFFVRLRTGQDIPVSGPYQGMVREMARAARIPLKN